MLTTLAYLLALLPFALALSPSLVFAARGIAIRGHRSPSHDHAFTEKLSWNLFTRPVPGQDKGS